MALVDYRLQNPMQSFFQTAGGLQQLQSNQMEMQQQQAQQQAAAAQQAKIQELMPKVQAGDYNAAIELATVSPQLSEAINKAKSSMVEGQDRTTAQWIAGYQAAPDKEAYLASDNQAIDIDDQFRTMAPEQRDVLTKIVGAQVMPEQMFNATFGQPMSEFQAQDIDIKRENTKLRALEAGLRRDQQALNAESNDLKRQELRAKVEEKQLKVEEQKQKLASAQQVKESGRANAIEAANLAEQLLNDPGLSSITGTVQPRLMTVSGESQDLVNKANRLQSLLTVDNLKLMTGVLTDRDIAFLTNVASGLNVTEGGILGSEKGVKDRLQQIVNKIRQNVKKDEAPAATEQQPVSGQPQVGTVQQGYRFIGGDPSSPDSWEKI